MAAQLLRSSFIAGVIFLFGIVIPPAFATINFAITNPNTSNDETEVEVNVTGLTSSSCLDNRCYLQGSLTAVDKNQYFGFTQNTENNWYEYQSSPSSSDVIKSTFFHFEPKEGSWSGKLKIKNNPNHANYQGPGQYLLAVRRYSGKAVSSAGESNSLTVTLSAILPTPTPPPTTQPTPTPASTPLSGGGSTSATDTPNSLASPEPSEGWAIGKVAGITTIKKNKSASFPAELKLTLDTASDSASLAALLFSPSPATGQSASPAGGSWPAYTIYSGVGLTGFAVAWLLVRSYNKGLLWPWLKLPFS